MVFPYNWRESPTGEVADVDHLLDLALALGHDLTHLQADQLAELMLVLAQLVPDLPHDLAPARSGYLAPLEERPVSAICDLLVLLLGDLPHVRDHCPIDRTGGLELGPRTQPFSAEAAEVVLLDSEPGQEILH